MKNYYMKQDIAYRLINTAGQITAVVLSPVSQRSMAYVARFLMQNDTTIEQVGFLTGKKFRMMGGELSVNGTLASKFIKNGTTMIRLPRSIIKSINSNQISFNGITYILLPGFPLTQLISIQQKKLLRTLTKTNPASGIIYYQRSIIKPLIYVRATESYVWEQSCGSGSIAYALFTGRKRIRQPSGKTVYVRISNSTITYQAQTIACPNQSILIGSKEEL